MSGLKTDCKKFSPNVFSKTKCQNCFRTKDAHSAEALECNRASRKVSKCGYLFVAPDWDFTVSINRTKRWQRRWFVLYDDGELTYSVDEHPDTIPQAVIDMNHVLEVADAEDITGNQFALAITAPEKVHFIKGTCRDESKWWYDVLSRYPKNTIRGKHKRNATFPGLKTALISENDTKENSKIAYENRIFGNRPRFLSCNSEDYEKNEERHWEKLNENEDVFPIKEVSSENLTTISNKGRSNSVIDYLHNHFVLTENTNNTLNDKNSFEDKSNIISTSVEKEGSKPVTETVINDVPAKEKIIPVDNVELMKGHSRRYLKRESRGLKSQRSRSDGVAKMIPPLQNREIDGLNYWSGLDFRIKKNSLNSQEKNYHHNPVYLLLSDVPSMKKYESLESLQKDGHSPLVTRRRHTSEKEDGMKPATVESKESQHSNNEEFTSKLLESPVSQNNGNNENSYKNGIPNWEKDVRQETEQSKSSFSEAECQVRGDPDGCGLDGISICGMSNPEVGTERSFEDMILKKGWLMRYSSSSGWCKHWFVLQNLSLSYYQDPSAEDTGMMDGALDVMEIRSVDETDSDRNYAFTITMWDDKKYLLSAVTAGIRNNWIQALTRVRSIWEDSKQKEHIIPSKLDSELNASDYMKEQTNRIATSPSPAPSMDEPDKALDVSSSDDHSEYFSIVDEGEFLCRTSSPRPLPPSPPLNRTAISRVKERARSRSSSRSRVGHPYWSSNGEMQHTGMDGDLHSDGGISDNSNSSFHGMSCLSDRKGICCDHPNLIASDIDETHINDEDMASDKTHERNLQNCVKRNKHLEKQDRSKEQKMHLLEEHCRELEIQLKKKEDEVGEKSAELNNLKSLKGSYHDLVEKYNSLKKRLEDCEKKVSGNGNDGKSYRLKYESLRTRYKKEKAEWEGRQGKDRNSEDISAALERNKKQLHELKTKLEKSPSRKDAHWSDWKETSKLCEEVESLASKEKYAKNNDMIKLKKSYSDLETICRTKQDGLDRHKREMQELLGTPEKDKTNVSSNEQKLSGRNDRGNSVKLMEENLISPNKKNVADSQVMSKLDRAKEEMRNLKKQLREAHNAYDELELHCFKLEQDMKGMEEIHNSQMALMTARVDDLTMKFTSSERNLRALRQKLAKAEAKQERRRSSLKGKEALNLSKEYEVKLSELEQKITVLETALQASPETEVSCRSSSEKNSDSMDSMEASSSCQKNLQKRRSSQESGEPQGLLLRLHNLDTKVKKASSLVDKLASNSVNEPVAEKPKILLQVKAGDDNEMAGESEDWSSLSVTTSLTDLSTIGGSDIDQEQPQSERECLAQLNKKVKSLLSWVKTVLEHLYNQNTSLSATQSSRVDSELGNVIGVLEYMCAIDTEKIFSSSRNYEKELVSVVYNLILIQEVARTLCRLNNFETYKCEVIMEHLSRINYMLILLDERLSCASVESMLKNEQAYSNCNTLMKFTRKLFSPQDTESSLEIENLTNHDQEEVFEGLNARLKVAEEKGKAASEFVTQFVNNKKKELINLLESISVTPEESVQQCSREVLLANISGAISEVLGRIENQLCIIENEQLSLLRYDWKSFYALVSAIRKNICQNTTSVSSELRQLVLDRPESCCSMVYLKHFVDIVTEIISVITMHSITMGSILFVRESIGQIHTQSTALSTGESNATDNVVRQSALCERLLNSAKKILGHYHPVDINSIWCDWFCSMTGGNQTTEILARESMMNLMSLKMKFKEEMEKERDAYEHKIQALQLQLNSGKNDCDNCRKLQFEICELKTKYEEQLLEKKGNCDHCEKLTTELNSLYRHLEDLNIAIEEEKQILQKNSQEMLENQEREFNTERDKTKKELDIAQRCLQQLKDEYDKQISSLQSTYEQKLLQHNDAISEEAIRQRYHLEIEQLKCLCGSGLNAMEKFHQHTISEMERRHRNEIALLEEEKKKALAEETQATITALQALKKAHREELQSEITKFKESYTQKMQSDKESGISEKQHKSELEDIKCQILSLSDKYSVKCLENASLEERMNSLRSQLQESNFQLFDLLARNKQLRAYLASDIAQKLDDLQSDRQASETEKLKHLLNVKEGELTRQQEEIAHLQQELHLAQTHADTLDIHCKQLDHSLKNERALREVEILSLQSRLETMLSKSSLECQDDSSSSKAVSSKKHDINVTCGRELARSESYPTLHRLSVPAVLQSASGNTPQGAETW